MGYLYINLKGQNAESNGEREKEAWEVSDGNQVFTEKWNQSFVIHSGQESVDILPMSSNVERVSPKVVKTA